MTINLRFITGLMALPLLAMVGCGTDETNSPTAKKLKGIANLYVNCALSTDKFTGPANEQDFKQYLRSQPDHVLGGQGFDKDTIDTAFVSARDKEPFVIVYGMKITGISGKEGPVVAHEKTGKNGQYLVSLTNGKVQIVDEAGLKVLKTPKE